IYGVALCDWWINNNDDLSEFTLENTTIRNFAEKQKAVRILSTKEDGSSYAHTGDLKINLINNKIVSDKPSSIAFSLENHLEKSELNLNGNVLSLTGSDSTVLSFTTTSCDYTGKIHNNDITLGPSGSFIKSSSGSIADNISNINWVDLTPGVNVPDIITWTGDDVNGWALVLGEKASGTGDKPKIYTFTQDVTISSMTVSAKDAVIDGNKGTCTLTLSGTKAQQGVITVNNGATLKNLNVVAAEDAAFGTAIKVVNGNLTGSTIDLRNQNAQPSSEGDRMSAIAVSVENGEISGNTIRAGNSATSSSQCVVVSGNGVTVSGNALTTGKSAAETEEGKRTSGSVGIRLSSEASGTTTIINNHITSTQGAGLNNGIAADGVENDVTIDASGNTFVLAAAKYGGGAFYVNPNPESGTITVTLDAEENTVESAASFIYADNAEGAKTYAIKGTIENNDFAAADKGLVSADELILTLGDLEQSGNSGLITDPSESLDVDTVASEITVTGAEVKQGGDNAATITFTGYEILITNATVSGSNIIYYNADSTATVTHNTVRHMDSSTNIRVELLITDMSKLEEISTPKATIGDYEKAQLAAEKITPLSVVDIHHKGEPGFDQITLTISGLRSSGEIIGFHVGKSGVDTSEVTIKDGKHIVTFTDLTSASPFGIGVISDGPQPVYSSGGNMDNAYRVLFNDGATTLSVQTDLSSGDKLTKPETPVKDGYTFAGWYKDSACTQPWDFETGIPGDMTLYAKWTAAGSSGETEATATPTATAVTTPQPTKTQTAAATTSAPQATTAAGVSPTLTQAPAPVAGVLFGLLAAGVLLRRRFQ
ncbi:MAG TPA: InlB B-repeat-containing protein, partial [Methanocorpusculum sp.]|nr:InlB B-repeat-containing protein [Methanocorpusculum sp.]